MVKITYLIGEESIDADKLSIVPYNHSFAAEQIFNHSISSVGESREDSTDLLFTNNSSLETSIVHRSTTLAPIGEVNVVKGFFDDAKSMGCTFLYALGAKGFFAAASTMAATSAAPMITVPLYLLSTMCAYKAIGDIAVLSKDLQSVVRESTNEVAARIPALPSLPNMAIEGESSNALILIQDQMIESASNGGNVFSLARGAFSRFIEPLKTVGKFVYNAPQ